MHISIFGDKARLVKNPLLPACANFYSRGKRKEWEGRTCVVISVELLIALSSSSLPHPSPPLFLDKYMPILHILKAKKGNRALLRSRRNRQKYTCNKKHKSEESAVFVLFIHVGILLSSYPYRAPQSLLTLYSRVTYLWRASTCQDLGNRFTTAWIVFSGFAGLQWEEPSALHMY